MNMIVRERHHNIYAMLLFAGISILSTQASAALKTWDGSDGNWSDPTAWGGQEPRKTILSKLHPAQSPDQRDALAR